MSEIYTGCVVCTGPSQMAIDLSLRSDCSKRFERLQPPLVLKLRKYCVFLSLNWECTTLYKIKYTCTTTHRHLATFLLQVRREKHLNQHWVFHTPAVQLTSELLGCLISAENQESLESAWVYTLSPSLCTDTSRYLQNETSGFDHWGACGKCPSSEKSKKAGRVAKTFSDCKQRIMSHEDRSWNLTSDLVILTCNRKAFLARHQS